MKKKLFYITLIIAILCVISMPIQDLKTNIRELFVRVKMFLDLEIDKQPHFLGEKYKLPSSK